MTDPATDVAPSTPTIASTTPKNALILLGCPQVPVQTSIALWLCAALNTRGVPCLVGGTPAARALLEVADPDRHYLTETGDLDAIIDAIAEGTREVDAVFVLVHNEAAVAYTATMVALGSGTTYALVFGGETEERIGDLAEVDCHIIAAEGSHNPRPLRRQVQEVLDTWDA